MSADDTSDKTLTRAEKFAKSRLEFQQKSKERAKEAKKAYLARPDVQEKLKKQKDLLKQRRKEKSASAKNARKSEKSALAEAQKMTRAKKQSERDQELKAMLGLASDLTSNSDTGQDRPNYGRSCAAKPSFTIIQGGRSSNS